MHAVPVQLPLRTCATCPLCARPSFACVQLTRDKLRCMGKSRWLNDEVINMYMLLLQVSAARPPAGPPRRVAANNALCAAGIHHSMHATAIGTRYTLDAADGQCHAHRALWQEEPRRHLRLR